MLPDGSLVQQGLLLLPRAKLSFEGTYSCHDANGHLLSSITLRLGRKPQEELGQGLLGICVGLGQLVAFPGVQGAAKLCQNPCSASASGSAASKPSSILCPAGLPGIPTISCRASNYENFSCSWTSTVETFLPTKYITTYR